jgi:hypothetical protein
MRTGALIGAIVGVAVMGVWIAEAVRSSGDEHSSPLFVDPKDLELSDLWYQDQVHFDFTICNRSDKKINIRDFRTSCSCTSVEPHSVTIPARSSKLLQCTWKPANTGPSPIDRFRSSFSAQIIPLCEDEDGHSVANGGWTFSGQVCQQLKLSAAAIAFENGTLTEGERFPEKSIEVALSPWVGVAGATADEAKVRCHLDRIDPKKYLLRVRPVEGLTAGELNTNISLICTCTASRASAPIPSVVVPVRGRIGHDVFATPELLDSGFVEVGKTTEEKIAIQSKSLRAFSVDKAVCSLEGVELAVAPTSIGPTQQIQVSFHPSKVGAFRGEIRIVCTRTDDSTRFVLNIPCAYVATARSHLDQP